MTLMRTKIQRSFALMVVSCLMTSPSHAFNATHFARCFSEDTIRIEGKYWYYEENYGRPPSPPAREVRGGTYAIENGTIRSGEYYGRRNRLVRVKGIVRLKNNDGSIVERIYIPLRYSDAVCD